MQELSDAQADLITTGLASTSDKIKALAQAGYKRSEIRKQLGIRYQHVRNVLIAAGIYGGLDSDVQIERAPVALEADPSKWKPTSTKVLLDGGFMLLGEWRQTTAGEIELTAKAPPDAGVYAFGVEGLVKYVGLTQRGLSSRMGHYRRGHIRQRTSARIKKLIVETLADKRSVQIFVAIPKEARHWHGLPVDVAAGLEFGLIKMIQPEWNMQGVKVAAHAVSEADTALGKAAIDVRRPS